MSQQLPISVFTLMYDFGSGTRQNKVFFRKFSTFSFRQNRGRAFQIGSFRCEYHHFTTGFGALPKMVPESGLKSTLFWATCAAEWSRDGYSRRVVVYFKKSRCLRFRRLREAICIDITIAAAYVLLYSTSVRSATARGLHHSISII